MTPAASPPAGTPPPSHPVAQTLALLHNWIDYVPPPQRRLGVFIFLAALLHVTTFFFIRIDLVRPELRHSPRLQVTLDSPEMSTASTPEDRFWDRVTDPRLYVLPLRAAPQPLDFAAQFNELNEDTHPVALPAPAEIGTYPFLNDSQPPLAERVEETMHPARQPFVYHEDARPILQVTTWQWEDALGQRRPADLPPLPSPVSDTEVFPTRLRLAVAPDGSVDDVLLEQTSRVPDLDRQAILAARKLRFAPAGNPARQWGLVTIAWYYTPKPAEVAPPPAPLAP